MSRRSALSPDKELLLEQFIKLPPAERLRYAFQMASFAIRINPKLMRTRRALRGTAGK